MIKRLFTKLEDPSRPLLGPNVKALKFCGLLLPKNIFLKCFYILLHLSAAVYVMAAFVDIWVVRSDLNLFLQNIKITIVASVSAVKAGTFIFWRKHWESIIDYVTMTDIEKRKTTNAKELAIIDKLTRYCRKISFFYWSFMYTTGLILILLPLIKFISSPVYRENVQNGTDVYLQIISSWTPFDKNRRPEYYAVSVYYSVVVYIGCGWISSFDTNAISIMVFFKGEIESLRKSCSEIFGTASDPVTDEEALERIKICHQRHMRLIYNAKLFNSCMSPVMFLYILVCSVVLCVTTFQITIESSTMERVLMSEYLLFNVAQLFMYCWHCNDVFYSSSYLMYGPYESVWWTRNTKLKRNVFILKAQLTKLVVFSAGPFTYLTITTFLNIVKGAYSYYTLLSQSQM